MCAKSTITKRRSFGNVKTVAVARDYDCADRAPDAPNIRCQHCGERIGVYEILVEVSGNVARRTSRAADPLFDASGGGTVFHAACYDGPMGPMRASQQ
jgi:hypothetical protein